MSWVRVPPGTPKEKRGLVDLFSVSGAPVLGTSFYFANAKTLLSVAWRPPAALARGLARPNTFLPALLSDVINVNTEKNIIFVFGNKVRIICNQGLSMKKAIYFILGIWLMSSCSTIVTSNIAQTQLPLESVDDVVVLNEKEAVPSGYGLMGEIQIKDKYNYNILVDMTRKVAWEKGAKYIKVKKYYSAGDVRSDIHVIASDVYGLGNFSPSVFTKKRVKTDDLLPPERKEDIFHAGRSVKGDFYFTLRGSNDPFVYKAFTEEIMNSDADDLGSALTTSIAIGAVGLLKDASTYSVGAGFLISPKWFLEVGGSFLISSMSSDKVVASTGSLSFIHNHSINDNNLFWIPKYELNYTGITNADFNFVSLGLTPLAFEYRFRSYAFQFSVGKFGMIVPLEEGSKAFSVFSSFDSVSMGLVAYF